MEAKPTQKTALECEHCGDVAIESDAEGYYEDGDGGRCKTCGFPGMVSINGAEAWWNESLDRSARCTDPECRECNPLEAA